MFSTFQALVDQVLSGTDTKLILVGSSVSIMTSRVLSYRRPHGRKILAMQVKSRFSTTATSSQRGL